VLSRDERLRFGVASVNPATIIAIHTPVSVDLQFVLSAAPANPKSATITSFSIGGNLVRFVGNNNFANGDVVTISGLSTGAYLNGQTLTVLLDPDTPGTVFLASFTHANVGVTSDTGTSTQSQTTITETNVSWGQSEGNWYQGPIGSNPQLPTRQLA
jgi:hypothetical protein